MRGVVRACYAEGKDLDAVRGRLLPALQRVVPFDAAFMAGADPDTLLFTSVYAENPLATSAPLFLDNEFGPNADVNRFVDLARASDPVATLDDATSGERVASARWREIMGPLGLGDELRVALRVEGTTWGFLCLHRSGATGFTGSESAALRKIAPHAAESIRRVAAASNARAGNTEASEAVILVADHVVLAVGGAVDEIEGGPLIVGGRLPVPLAAVVRRLEAIEIGDAGGDAAPASIRMTTRRGALATVHAARLGRRIRPRSHRAHHRPGCTSGALVTAPSGPWPHASPVRCGTTRAAGTNDRPDRHRPVHQCPYSAGSPQGGLRQGGRP